MKNGEIVKLECLGTTSGPRWLEGNPDGPKVQLVANPTTGKSSCSWRVHSDVRNEKDVFLFENLSTTVGNHWLDGLTDHHQVTLSTHSDKPYTGIRWRARPDPQKQKDVYLFECLGQLPGNKWLDGLTATGKVELAPSTTGHYTGTRWKVQS